LRIKARGWGGRRERTASHDGQKHNDQRGEPGQYLE
jgi:hypothetical protein